VVSGELSLPGVIGDSGEKSIVRDPSEPSSGETGSNVRLSTGVSSITSFGDKKARRPLLLSVLVGDRSFGDIGDRSVPEVGEIGVAVAGSTPLYLSSLTRIAAFSDSSRPSASCILGMSPGISKISRSFESASTNAAFEDVPDVPLPGL